VDCVANCIVRSIVHHRVIGLYLRPQAQQLRTVKQNGKEKLSYRPPEIGRPAVIGGRKKECSPVFSSLAP
jgi:hypothetical protein